MPVRPTATRDDYAALAALLRRRLETIGDAAWRQSDPAGHLDALRAVSEALTAWHESHRGGLPGKLEHLLANCSFEKALFLVENELIS